MQYTLNQKTIQEILDLPNGQKILLEIIDIFLQTAPEKILAIKQAASIPQFEPTYKEAHALKSSCQAVGAWELAHLCGEIELLAKANEQASLQSMVSQLDEMYSYFEKLLKTEQQLHRDSNI